MTLAAAAVEDMQAAVLDWYAGHARDLAFRRTSDPWGVLVSEVIAQQTQAARAAEAWIRFIADFPTPAALAAASPATAIRAWRGLGYNRRAIALREAAIAIVERHAGSVPRTLDELVELPGVGPYTARAVLAIAFNEPVAALDTNIRRVVGRAFLGDRASTRPRDLQPIADGFVPHGRAAAWTHALMDVGAAFCRKREPRCGECPLAEHCQYRAAGLPHEAPGRAVDRRPFRSTNRWLRGRILDRLRDASDDAWVGFTEPIGQHGLEAVRDALEALAREGLLELEASGLRARLRR